MGYHQLRQHQNVVPIVESQPLKAWGLPTGLSGRHGRMPKIARRSEEQMHFHCWSISFGVRQPIVCQWGYTCPCQWSWKSYLILPANALLFVFNPQHFCFQPTSGLGRTRSIECWLPKSKPTCHKGTKENGPGWWPWSREPWRWRPWPMGQTIGIPQARSTSGIGPHQACEPTPTQPVGIYSTVHQWLTMKKGPPMPSAKEHRHQHCLWKGVWAPWQGCQPVWPFLGLPLAILWQLGLHVLCFLFAHMFSPGLIGLMQQQNFFI